jgi:O-antigen ligase
LSIAALIVLVFLPTHVILWQWEGESKAKVFGGELALYAADLAALGMIGLVGYSLILFARRKRKSWRAVLTNYKYDYIIMLWFGWLCWSALRSDVPLLSIGHLFHLFLGWLAFIALRFLFRQRVFFLCALLALVTIIFLQASWAAFQFALQRDLGLRWLDESWLAPQLLGVAKINVYYNFTLLKVMRAYGLTPHPNILGLLLSLSPLLLAGGFLFFRLIPPWSWMTIGLVSFLGLVVSFSRSGWLAFVVAAFLALKILASAKLLAFKPLPLIRIARKLIPVTSVALVYLFLLSPLISARLQDPITTSPIKRVDEWKIARYVVKESPWRGVGFGLYPIFISENFPSLQELQFSTEGIAPETLKLAKAKLKLAKFSPPTRADFVHSLANLIEENGPAPKYSHSFSTCSFTSPFPRLVSVRGQTSPSNFSTSSQERKTQNLAVRERIERVWVFQPVHNFFILAIAETGIIGAGLLLFWMLSFVKQHPQGSWLLTVLLPAALFDHLLWTSSQGRMVFWIVLAVAANWNHIKTWLKIR